VEEILGKFHLDLKRTITDFQECSLWELVFINYLHGIPAFLSWFFSTTNLRLYAQTQSRKKLQSLSPHRSNKKWSILGQMTMRLQDKLGKIRLPQ
jgi:hypothetical protein